MSEIALAVIGFVILCGICWACVMAGLLERGAVDRYEDGEQSNRDVETIVAATRPGALEDEPRPHVRAGTAWGKSS